MVQRNGTEAGLQFSEELQLPTIVERVATKYFDSFSQKSIMKEAQDLLPIGPLWPHI